MFQAAFDDAIAELDTLSEESYKDSTLIMQVMVTASQVVKRRTTLSLCTVPLEFNKARKKVQSSGETLNLSWQSKLSVQDWSDFGKLLTFLFWLLRDNHDQQNHFHHHHDDPHDYHNHGPPHHQHPLPAAEGQPHPLDLWHARRGRRETCRRWAQIWRWISLVDKKEIPSGACWKQRELQCLMNMGDGAKCMVIDQTGSSPPYSPPHLYYHPLPCKLF